MEGKSYYNYFNNRSRHSFRRSSSSSPSSNSSNINNIISTYNNNNPYITQKSKADLEKIESKTAARLSQDALAIASHLIEIANRRSPSPPKSFSKSPSPLATSNTFSGIPTAHSINNNSANYYLNNNNVNYNNVASKPPVFGSSFRPPTVVNSGPLSAPARLDEKEKYFLPFTFPEQFPYKIPAGMTTNGGTSPAAVPSANSRRFSEENSFRRPLGKLNVTNKAVKFLDKHALIKH